MTDSAVNAFSSNPNIPAVLATHRADGLGVSGITSAAHDAAVLGTNDGGGWGVTGRSATGVGVSGESTSSIGVSGSTNAAHDAAVLGTNGGGGWGVTGRSATGVGVSGESTSSIGVSGSTNAANDAAVLGINGGGGRGVTGRSANGVGVSGESTNGAGVCGQSTAANGVLATSQDGQGVTAFSDNDTGIFAQGGTFAAVFKGALVVGKGPGPKNPAVPPNQVDGSIVINDGGSLFLNGGGDVLLAGPSADCAEDFEIANPEVVEPGTVMVLGEGGLLEPSQFAYDRRVAGVISGAGGYKPGIILDKLVDQPGRKPIALIGKIYCKVDAQYGSVEVGDLLTTSPTFGHAMKATDQVKAFGSIIGKALEPLPSGTGLIRMLVSLQ
jgi:hypothetical protein